MTTEKLHKSGQKRGKRSGELNRIDVIIINRLSDQNDLTVFTI